MTSEERIAAAQCACDMIGVLNVAAIRANAPLNEQQAIQLENACHHTVARTFAFFDVPKECQSDMEIEK